MKLQEAGARFAGQAGWQESSTMGQDRLPFSVLRAGVSPYGPGICSLLSVPLSFKLLSRPYKTKSWVLQPHLSLAAPTWCSEKIIIEQFQGRPGLSIGYTLVYVILIF